MGSLSTARTFGGIGSILILLFIIPTIGWLVSIVGWILVLIAASNIGDVVGDKSIFRDTMVAGILAILGLVVGVVVLVASVLRFFGLNGLKMYSGPGYWQNLNTTSFATGQITDLGGLVVGVIGGLVLLWVFYIASAFFLRRGFTKIADRLNVKMFATAALLYLIGAALTIILIGLVVIFIADILMVVAFFSMPDDTSTGPPPAPMAIPPPPPPVPAR